MHEWTLVWQLTFVKKSLQPAANASCRSLCSELAVKATMMTGLLKSAVFIKISSSFDCTSSSLEPSFIASPRPNVGVLLALLVNTPISLTFSNLLISLVASKPFMIGNWISMRTRWKPPSRQRVTASLPFIAVDQRTFSLLRKASNNLRLIMLSSTTRTLMGGTELSRRLADVGKEVA